MVSPLEAALGAPPAVFLNIWNVPHKFWVLAFERRKVQDQVERNRQISGTEMKKELSWLSLACMGVGTIIATGVFSYMPRAYSSIDGPAVLLSLLLASSAAFSSALVYSEFAVEYPVLGGGFVYVLNTFGEYPAVLCASNMVIDYVFGPAAVVRNFSVYLSQIIEDIRGDELTKNYFRFGSNGNEGKDVLALSIVLFLSLITMWSMKVFDRANIGLHAVHIIILLIIIVAAFTQFSGDHWSPFLPEKCAPSTFEFDNNFQICASFNSTGSLPLNQKCLEGIWGPNGLRRIITGASNTFFLFIGYDVVVLAAEEANTGLSVPIGMFAALSFCTVIYLLLAAALVSLASFYSLSCVEKTRAFWHAFDAVNMKWGGYMVSFGACIGIFTSCGLNLFGLSRIFQVFAREGMIPVIVGSVNSVTYTPIIAIAMAGIVAGLMSLFASFEQLGKMTSIGTLTMYWFVSIALLFRRYAPEFEGEEQHGDRHLSIPFRPKCFNSLSVKFRKAIILFYIFLLTSSAIGFAVCWNLKTEGSQYLLLLTFLAWFCTTVTFQCTLPLNYVPKSFGVPWFLMPWVPSFSIWMNIMLVGGFGNDQGSYYRLFIGMAIGTLVYLLFGVHASYWRFYGVKREEKELVQPDVVKEDSDKILMDHISLS